MLRNLLAGLFVLIMGCSSGGSSGSQSAAVNNTNQEAGSGSIAVQLAWDSTAKSTARVLASVPSSVATVRIIVSGPGIAAPLQKDFLAATGTGTIDGVLAGSDRTVTARGLDASGTATYEGTATNITVTAGQTTDVGTITMITIASEPVTLGSFHGNIILGSPAAASIKASVFSSDQSGTVILKYGTTSGIYDKQTAPAALAAGVPVALTLDHLSGNTRYYYRLYFQASTGTGSGPTEEYTFHTARAEGSSVTFTIQADSHLDENSDLDLYRLTLANVLADAPDFHIDLGDTFMSEKHSAPLTATVQTAPDQTTVNARYAYERSNFGIAAHSAPLFLVNGNHEGELGWLANGTSDNIAIWATKARQQYFLNPTPDSFYTGDAVEEPFVGKRASWYAWHWGNALFVVLDPYWYTKTKTNSDGWVCTLGATQYQWLQQTLAASPAKFKFVFIHNLVGGLDGQMRGGIEAAPFFEWGGKNPDGTDGFSQKRPGWSEPIHQLLVRHGVTAVFHGHDHLYAKQVLDGIIYQEVPQPSAINSQSGLTLATAYHYTAGTIVSSSGHLRVTVTPNSVTVGYVRAWLPKNETVQRKNGQLDDLWSIVKP